MINSHLSRAAPGDPPETFFRSIFQIVKHLHRSDPDCRIPPGTVRPRTTALSVTQPDFMTYNQKSERLTLVRPQ